MVKRVKKSSFLGVLAVCCLVVLAIVVFTCFKLYEAGVFDFKAVIEVDFFEALGSLGLSILADVYGLALILWLSDDMMRKYDLFGPCYLRSVLKRWRIDIIIALIFVAVCWLFGNFIPYISFFMIPLVLISLSVFLVLYGGVWLVAYGRIEFSDDKKMNN